MSWYYATKDKTQAGPVDDATLADLLRAGEITSETLVWKEGMTGWMTYAAATGSATPPALGMARCVECGRAFPPDQLITLAGRSICGACKPLAVQKFQEGVVSFGRTGNPEELWDMVQRRGFDFTIGSVLSRAWALVTGNFWPCLGVTLLAYLIMMGASQIPCAGILAGVLVQPQIMAGLYWYFLKQFRGQEATLNDSFDGFRRGYGQQAIYMLVWFVPMMILMVPLMGAFIWMAPTTKGGDNTAMMGLIWTAIVVGAVVMPIIWYLMICWAFTPILILDKGLKALEAMKLSRRVMHLRFWKVTGLFLLLGLLGMLSFLALIVGALVMMPVFFAAMSRLYEDAFHEEGSET